MILTGKGGCGKSVILNELLRIVGNENTSAIPLQQISDRFSTKELLYKTTNICGDLENNPLKDTSVIKQATGQDLLKGEIKGGRIFSSRIEQNLYFLAMSYRRFWMIGAMVSLDAYLLFVLMMRGHLYQTLTLN